MTQVKTTGRGGYRQAVADLHQMKKIGQAARVEALVGRIHTQYPN